MLGKQRYQFDVSFRNNWDKPIHRWYHFHAGCSSEFPERIIKILRIRKGCTVLDPFVGSGTVLVCAKERGFDSIGLDVNPFYVFVAGVKTYWEFDMECLFDLIESLSRRLKMAFNAKVLCTCSQKTPMIVGNIPTYIRRYFKPEVFKELSMLKKIVSEVETESIRNLLLLALASILIGVSNVHYVGETIVFDKPAKANDVPIHEVYIKKIWEMYSDLKTKQLIPDKGDVEVKRGDARYLNDLIPDGSIDHVITHPPYVNNYNYLLHDRLPLFFLEYFRTLSDEKKMRDLIIGSVTNNKVSIEFSSDISEVQEIAENVKSTGDIERYKAVLEYFDSMNFFLKNLHNKLKNNGYCAMLVGNSYVRGVMIPLDIIMTKLAENNDFEVIKNSVVRDRGNGAFQHLYNGRLYESIVILKRS